MASAFMGRKRCPGPMGRDGALRPPPVPNGTMGAWAAAKTLVFMRPREAKRDLVGR